jgi:hypothetical protein
MNYSRALFNENNNYVRSISKIKMVKIYNIGHLREPGLLAPVEPRASVNRVSGRVPSRDHGLELGAAVEAADWIGLEGKILSSRVGSMNVQEPML